MKFRVHLFAVVRVEHELDADTPEEAAQLTFTADLDLHRCLAGPGQEFAEEVDDVCLVDPLTDKVDQEGRQVPDDEWSQWLRVTEFQQPDGSLAAVVQPALGSSQVHFHVRKSVANQHQSASTPSLVA